MHGQFSVAVGQRQREKTTHSTKAALVSERHSVCLSAGVGDDTESNSESHEMSRKHAYRRLEEGFKRLREVILETRDERKAMMLAKNEIGTA